jgi:hypothetical protein
MIFRPQSPLLGDFALEPMSLRTFRRQGRIGFPVDGRLPEVQAALLFFREDGPEIDSPAGRRGRAKKRSNAPTFVCRINDGVTKSVYAARNDAFQ